MFCLTSTYVTRFIGSKSDEECTENTLWITAVKCFQVASSVAHPYIDTTYISGARYYTISQQHTWKSPLRIYQKAPVKTFWTVTVKQWNNSISWKVCFIITPHELKTEFIQCIACLSLVHEEKLWRWRKVIKKISSGRCSSPIKQFLTLTV